MHDFGDFDSDSAPFEQEYAAFLVVTHGVPTQELVDEEIEELAQDLSEDNPYVGEEVVLATRDESTTINSQGLSCLPTPPGKLTGTLNRFFVSEGDGAARLLLELEQDRDGDSVLIFINRNDVESIQLKEKNHPFKSEEEQLKKLARKVQREVIQVIDGETVTGYDDEEVTSFVQSYVNHFITPYSSQVGSTMELWLSDFASIELHPNMVVPWIALAVSGASIETCIDKHSNPMVPDTDEEAAMVGMEDMYRGIVSAKIIGFSFDWEWEILDEEPKLRVIVEPEAGEPLLEDYENIRFAGILAEDIARAKVVQGPALN